MKPLATATMAAAIAATPAIAQTLTIVNGSGLYTVSLPLLTSDLVMAGSNLSDVAASDVAGEVFVRTVSDAYSAVELTSGSSTLTGVSASGGAFGEGNNGLWYTNSDSATVAGSVLTAIDPRNPGFAPQPVLDLGSRIGDIAALPNGRLFASLATGDVVEIDLADGTFAVAVAAGKVFEGLASTADGVLYGFTGVGGVFELDVDNGLALDTGKIAGPVLDAGSQIAIPAPASVLALAGLPLLSRRRR